MDSILKKSLLIKTFSNLKMKDQDQVTNLLMKKKKGSKKQLKNLKEMMKKRDKKSGKKSNYKLRLPKHYGLKEQQTLTKI